MGGGGFGKSESSAKQGAQFGQDVFGPQASALQNMYGQVGNLFSKGMNQMGQQVPGAIGQQQQVFDASMPAYQQMLQGGAYAGMPLQSMYQDALGGGGNEAELQAMIMGGAGNNYAQAMQDQLAGDAMDRLGRSFAAADARASAAGQPGSSRHGLLQARMAQDEMDRLADAQTNIGYQTFDKDLQRKLDIARRADQFDAARLQNVSGMLGAQNQAMQGGLGFGAGQQALGMGQFSPTMAPFQMVAPYAGAIGAPTVLSSGESSATSDSKGKSGSGWVGPGGG